MKAFGPQGHGICFVKNIPEYEAKRLKLLTLSYHLAHLSEAQLQRLEVPELNYGIGWSKGKERFRGTIDTGKGSFYANPL